MSDVGPQPNAPVRVLFVCRANAFRSPIAAALLQRRLAGLGEVADVRSAGSAADPRASNDALVRTVRNWGVDLSGHQSRQLDLPTLAHEDLVLMMEHHQVAEVIAAQPEVFPHTFTLKELVRRAEAIDARAEGEPFPSWVQRVHAGRTRLGLVGAWSDDVTDPAGRPEVELERTLGELDDLVGRFVDAAWSRPKGRRRRR